MAQEAGRWQIQQARQREENGKDNAKDSHLGLEEQAHKSCDCAERDAKHRKTTEDATDMATKG